MKIAFVVAAAVLTTAPLVTPAKAQGVKMAQVDMQTGRHFEDRDPVPLPEGDGGARRSEGRFKSATPSS